MRIFYYIEQWPYSRQHSFPTLNQLLCPAQTYGTNLTDFDPTTLTRPMPSLTQSTSLRLTLLRKKPLWMSCWNLIFQNHINTLRLLHLMPFQIHRSSQPPHRHLPNANQTPKLLPRHLQNVAAVPNDRDPVPRARCRHGLSKTNKNSVLWRLMRNLVFHGVWSRPRWANLKPTFVPCGTRSKTNLVDYLRCGNGKKDTAVSFTTMTCNCICLTISCSDCVVSLPYHFVTTVSPIHAPSINLNHLICYSIYVASCFMMSLRTHLDRYCQQRAMANDHISPTRRSRSPNRAPSSATGTSPFQRPPDWTPPSTTPHRPVILQLDLKPMQQLADRNPYFNILAPKVAGNLLRKHTTAFSKPSRWSTRTTPAVTLFQTWKLWWRILSCNDGRYTCRPPTSTWW